MQRWTSGQAREAAAAIVRVLADAGHTAYFAGGCVRDELLGLKPTDYDVATDARPQEIQTIFKRTAPVGASFGVVLVKERGVTVEVATFRSDGPYSDKRRPDHVAFSDARHDAQRRDFTINALFLDPLAAADAAGVPGHAIDFVGGLDDLRAGIIRAVGEPAHRLAEDHLRALRAVRFAARYGFAIEAATAEAIRAHARALEGVSRERIGDELRRMMAHPTRGAAADLLRGLGLEAVVLPGRAGGIPGGALARLPAEVSLAACLACWALERGEVGSGAQVPSLVSRWRRSLCLSNEESDLLRDVLRGVLEFAGSWDGLSRAGRKRRAAMPWFPHALAVLGARDAGRAGAIGAEVDLLAGDGIGLAPPPLISGDDLIRAGLRAGPAFARMLAAAYDAQLEGRVREKADALRLASELQNREGV